LVVSSAAILKAYQHIKTESENVIESFRKGQVSTGGITGINAFDLEIAFLDTKYPFRIEVIADDVYRLTLNNDHSFDVQITVTVEGALLATFGGETHRIFGMDEPLGLRLTLDGVTVLMPTIFDPSELRTDVTGKVVRYLQENGGDVEIGEPFVEVEAMKMIMPIKASESGKITHNLSPGTVINAGDLLASLTLKDPSKVKKILPFSGDFDIPMESHEFDVKDAVKNTLSGYGSDPEAIAAAAFQQLTDISSASELVSDTIYEFIRVESMFDGKLKDDVVRQMAKDNAEDLGVVISLNQAHQQLPRRSQLMLAMLRQVETFSSRFVGESIPQALLDAINNISELQDPVYGEIVLAAKNFIRETKIEPFEDRIQELRDHLIDNTADLDALSKSATLSVGVDLLTYLFKDSDARVRAAAAEVYVRRVYRSHRITNLIVDESDGKLQCSWSFQSSYEPQSKSPSHYGSLSVISSSEKLKDELPNILAMFGSKFDGSMTQDGPINVLHIAAVDGKEPSIAAIEEAFASEQSKMNMLGIRTANYLIPVFKRDPLYYTFPQYKGYREDPLRRNMRPTFYHLLELPLIDESFDLTRLSSANRNSQVYIGTEKAAKPMRGGSPQVVFVRGVSHQPGLLTLRGAIRAIVVGLDELERAQSNPKASSLSSSRIFLHSMPELEGIVPSQLADTFSSIMDTLKSRFATRLLKLRVDEIELKVRIAQTDEEGQPFVQSVRLVSSSMEGEWLKTAAFTERIDPITEVVKEYCTIEKDGVGNVCFLTPYGTSNIIQTKRSIARRVGSTYAYDFLGLLEVGLIGKWNSYLKTFSDDDGTAETIPSGIFSSQELIEDNEGELSPGTRPIGTNKVGMVAWVVNMKTPEYSNGRDVVFIANDVTVQSGSFGVPEDELYFKASKYARERGLPRVYISCNAGARIGLVDELKPKFKIKFVDDAAPAKGFEYLYLTDEDYAELAEGTVNAHKVTEGWAIDDIIGTNHGIGVENLQGSGMIAGETSRAYNEIFTLSYVTGRSVGIGAYLVRLGQRVIQMKQGPMLLTGFSALNKLLGKEVYNSQDQLGGPQIMFPNGVSHEIVENDQEGVASILDWLSFVPKSVVSPPAVRRSADPVDRDVVYRPTPTPYDPRLMLTGSKDEPGFFDIGSYKEYLAGWGKSVVVGRGRLGGIPMGSIAVETRLVEQVIPADPADPNSREAVLPQAGQVLFPDSSYKTAQAIRDFGKEGLPIMIFANWRGFSGGSRDMAGEILKFGAMIVDALREYEHPVYIYLPPHGELRGGSWVVVDPTINEEKMSMYADPDSRGGILEPAGIVEVKFRQADQNKVMHRLDPQLRLLDSELEMVDEFDDGANDSISEQILSRENELKPVYTQVATEFADLHDKTGRMKAKGVIKGAVPWSRSREFFFFLAKRRILEDGYITKIKAADTSMDSKSAAEVLKSMYEGDWENNQAAIDFLQSNSAEIEAKIIDIKKVTLATKIDAMKTELESL